MRSRPTSTCTPFLIWSRRRVLSHVLVGANPRQKKTAFRGLSPGGATGERLPLFFFRELTSPSSGLDLEKIFDLPLDFLAIDLH